MSHVELTDNSNKYINAFNSACGKINYIVSMKFLPIKVVDFFPSDLKLIKFFFGVPPFFLSSLTRRWHDDDGAKEVKKEFSASVSDMRGRHTLNITNSIRLDAAPSYS